MNFNNQIKSKKKKDESLHDIRVDQQLQLPPYLVDDEPSPVEIVAYLERIQKYHLPFDSKVLFLFSFQNCKDHLFVFSLSLSLSLSIVHIQLKEERKDIFFLRRRE